MRNPEVVKQVKLRYARSPRGQFIDQRKSAKRRGIEWRLTFEQWRVFWGDKLHLRGKTAGKLVMAREGDKGPYALNNVSIVPTEVNLSDRQLPQGARHHGARLVDGDVHRIRDLIACGVGAPSIARYFNVCATTIKNIRAGLTWGSV